MGIELTRPVAVCRERVERLRHWGAPAGRGGRVRRRERDWRLVWDHTGGFGVCTSSLYQLAGTLILLGCSLIWLGPEFY